MKQPTKYYNKTETLSYGAYFNMLISHRGVGKTYSYKTWGIDDFDKTGKQFVWVRRYGTEIKIMKKKFFKDIAKKYPNRKFEITGDKQFGEFHVDNKICGYYIALTSSSIAKSTPFPLVDKIIFDEFLIFGNTYHYLENEVDLFLELVESIFRDREDDTTAVQPRGIYLLGNNITLANPYFMYFHIPPFKQRFYRDKNRDILVEMYENKEFIEKKKLSHIGRLTAGTTYEKYSIENKSYLDNDMFIKKKTPQAKFYCCIDYKKITYGFWLDWKEGRLYANYQYDPTTYNHYSLTREDHTINTFLIKSTNSTYIKNILYLYKTGNLYFEDTQIKNQVVECLGYFLK